MVHMSPLNELLMLYFQVSDVEHNVPPMDNPTTIALYMCKRMVLRPYMRLLEVVSNICVGNKIKLWAIQK